MKTWDDVPYFVGSQVVVNMILPSSFKIYNIDSWKSTFAWQNTDLASSAQERRKNKISHNSHDYSSIIKTLQKY
jgi:hypothetical protein